MMSPLVFGIVVLYLLCALLEGVQSYRVTREMRKHLHG